MPNFIDLTGHRFGRWTVLEFAGKTPGGLVQWKCRCDCGQISTVQAGSLRRGRTKSCGCLKKRLAAASSTTHGMTHHPLYEVWQGMHQRCRNPNGRSYARYGGRGITVDPRWFDFVAFIADMGERPEGASIERIDNDGPYSPDNCKWATPAEQGANTRQNRLLTANGETHHLREWSRRLQIDNSTLSRRINKIGWEAAHTYYAARLNTAPSTHRSKQ